MVLRHVYRPHMSYDGVSTSLVESKPFPLLNGWDADLHTSHSVAATSLEKRAKRQVQTAFSDMSTVSRPLSRLVGPSRCLW